jgi:hypothetical protein
MATKNNLMKMLGAQAKATPGMGMADDVPAIVDGTAPAALSEGEHVIPADVVALLGDGNNEAGHKVLDGMIEMIRQKKTGQKEQPEPMAKLFKGGKVNAYAAGGQVKFDGDIYDETGNWYANPEKELQKLQTAIDTMKAAKSSPGASAVQALFGASDMGASGGKNYKAALEREQMRAREIANLEGERKKLEDYIKTRDRKHPYKKTGK